MIKNWTKDEILELKYCYATTTKEELVAKFNTSWAKIKNKAAKIGGLNRQKCNIDEQALIADYKTNIPLKDLWVKYNVSNPTIIKILSKHNIAKRNNRLNNIDIAQFGSDYTSMSIHEISRKYDVSRPTIITTAKQLGLVRPKVFLHKQPKLLKVEHEICKKYTENNKSMDILSKEYNVHTSTIFNLLHKHNIEIKDSKYGATEQQIREWLKEVTGKDFLNTREVLKGKEIDLYNVEYNTGIEYCGLHWHNEKAGRGVNYHYDKYKLCKEKNIRLITIFEDEWYVRQPQIKGALLSILNINVTRLYARKCEVKLITKAIGNAFYDDQHIQGKASLGIYFAGLYYNTELIGVMSFGKHHRDTTKYVLDRLCFKAGLSVAGGSSKLFKFLLKESNVTELVSWSDNRWFQGKVYEKLGFTKDCELGPDYSYVDTNKNRTRVSKQSQKKGNVNCPDDMTEKEWCYKRGLYRIWDCGKIRWIWKQPSTII